MSMNFADCLYGRCAGCMEWIMEKRRFDNMPDDIWVRKENYAEAEFLMRCAPECHRTREANGLRVAFEFEKFFRGPEAVDRVTPTPCAFVGGSKLSVALCTRCRHELREIHHPLLWKAIVRGWKREVDWLVQGRKREPGGTCKEHRTTGRFRMCGDCEWDVLPATWTQAAADEHLHHMRAHFLAVRLS